MTAGLIKSSSKQKQKLHDKFLIRKRYINEIKYYYYKNLFEKIYKKEHYSRLLCQHQSNNKKHEKLLKKSLARKNKVNVFIG